MLTQASFSFKEQQAPSLPFLQYVQSTLIWGGRKQPILNVFLEIWCEIQILALLIKYISDSFGSENFDAYSAFWLEVGRRLTLQDVLQYTSIGTSFILYIFSSIIVFLLIILSAYVVIEFLLNKQVSSKTLAFRSNLVSCHEKGFFFYIHTIMLTVIKKAADGDYIWDGADRTFLMVWSTMILVLNLFLGLIYVSNSIDLLKTNYILSKRSSRSCTLAFLFKCIDIPFAIFLTDPESKKWVRIVFALLLLTGRLVIYLEEFPYYHYAPLKAFLQFQVVELGMVATLFLLDFISLFRDYSNGLGVYFVTLIIPILLKVGKEILSKMIETYATMPNKKIKTTNLFFKKLFAANYIFKVGSMSRTIHKEQRDTHLEYIFHGLLREHARDCESKTCGCSMYLEEGSNSESLPLKGKQNELAENFLFEYHNTFYQVLTDKINKAILVLAYAFFLFEHKPNSHVSCAAQIHSIDLRSQSTAIRVVAGKLLRKIEKRLKDSNNNEGLIDTKSVVDYLNTKQLFRSTILESINEFKKFWESFKENNAKFKKLIDLSVKVNHLSEKINNYFTTMTTKTPTLCITDYIPYGLYMGLMRSAPHTAELTFSKYFTLSNIYLSGKAEIDTIMTDNIQESKNIVFFISLQKDEGGRVVYSTPNITRFGYNHVNILDKNLMQLIPFLAQNKKQQLHQYFEELTNKNTETYLYNNEGFIVPITVYIAPFPYCQSGFYYVTIIRPRITFDEFLFLKVDGTIEAVSKNVAETLNIDLKEKRYHLSQFTDEFVRILRSVRKFGIKPEKLPPPVFERSSSRLPSLTKGAFARLGTLARFEEESEEDSPTLSVNGNLVNQRRGGKTLTFQKLLGAKSLDRADTNHEITQPKTMTHVDDELQRDIESFTNNGIHIKFHPYGSDRDQLEYTTKIAEEMINGQKLYYLKLQSAHVVENSHRESQSEISSESSIENLFQDIDERSVDEETKSVERYGSQSNISGSSFQRYLNSKLKEISKKRPTTVHEDSHESGDHSEDSEEISRRKPKSLFGLKHQSETKREAETKRDPDTKRESPDVSRILGNPSRFFLDESSYETPNVTKRQLLPASGIKDVSIKGDASSINLDDDNLLNLKETPNGSPNHSILTFQETPDNSFTALSKLPLKKGHLKNFTLAGRKDSIAFSIPDENRTPSNLAKRANFGIMIHKAKGGNRSPPANDSPGLKPKKYSIIGDNEKGILKEKDLAKLELELNNSNNNESHNKDTNLDRMTHKTSEKEKIKEFLHDFNLSALDGTMGDLHSSSSFAGGKMNLKLEAAVYANQREPLLHLLKWFLILYFIGTMGMLIFHQIRSSSSIHTLDSNAELLTFSISRLFWIVEAARRTTIVTCTDAGLIPEEKNDADDWAWIISLDFQDVSTNMSYYNSMLRSELYKTEEDEQPRFFTPMYVKMKGELERTIHSNSFDVVSQLVTSCLALYEKAIETGTHAEQDDTDLQFIMENTLDDLIIRSEDVFDILKDDSKIKLGNVNKNSVDFSMSVLGIGGAIMLILFYYEWEFSKERQIFIDSLFRIRNDEIEETMQLCAGFAECIILRDKEENYFKRLERKVIDIKKKRRGDRKEDKDKNFRVRHANTDRVKTITYLNVIFLFIWVFSYSMLFLAFLIKSKSYSDIMTKEQDRLVQANLILTKYSIAMTGFYQLLWSNGSSTIKNDPVNMEWEDNLENLTRAVDFFVELKNDKDLKNQTITTLISDDLCETLFQDDEQCYTRGKGSAAQGMTGMNSYMLNSLRGFKDKWDDSEKTSTDAEGILSDPDFWDMENIFYFAVLPAYKDLSRSLVNEFDITIDDFLHSSKELFWLSIGIIIGLSRVLFSIFVKFMKLERTMVRQMIRQIPLHIVMRNRYLRTYLVTHCNGVLDSVKSRL